MEMGTWLQLGRSLLVGMWVVLGLGGGNMGGLGRSWLVSVVQLFGGDGDGLSEMFGGDGDGLGVRLFGEG